MHVHLRYGTHGLPLTLPSEADITVLRMNPAEPVSDPVQAVLHTLKNPIGTSSLADLAEGRTTAAVTISDITRPVPNAVILPPILDTLNASGIPDDRITIVIGTGLHRPNTPDEIRSMVGEDIQRRCRIINHMAQDESTLAHIGETSRGTPVWINREFMAADLRIATSLIEPHLMAGYSGGRKAVCPGLAGVKTMRIMHGPEILSHPDSREGVLENNPFHEEATEIARMAGVDFITAVSLNEKRELTGVFSGDLEAAHGVGCRAVERHVSAWVDEPVDIVITTSAGYPLDLTFYQSVKGMTAALPILKRGGTIIMASACAEGIGSPTFTQLMYETTSSEQFCRRLADPDFFVVDQWQLQEMCKALDMCEILYYTDGLDAETLSDLLVTPVESVESGLQRALEKHGPDAKIAVIPDGPYVLPRVR